MRIPPIEITAADFGRHVEAECSPRATASEMEHTTRAHLRRKHDEDPAFYGRLSDRLNEILRDLEGRWEDMVEALEGLIQEALHGRRPDDRTGLDPQTQAPFLDLLQQEIAIVGFWDPQRAQAREGLRSWIVQTLDDADVLPFTRLEAVADRLMELAKSNHHRLTR